MNCANSNGVVLNGSDSRLIEDVEMLDGVLPDSDNGVVTNGNANGNASNGVCVNGSSLTSHRDDDMGKWQFSVTF